MELKEILNEIKKKEEQLSWEGTFAEYFEMAVKNPELTRLSHARIYDAILAAGTSTGRLGQKQYSLFSGELFGIEDTIEQVTEYFGSAGRRLDTRKRILLLIGPPASGKSTRPLRSMPRSGPFSTRGFSSRPSSTSRAS